MENVKPWQIILLIAAVGVLGFSIWKFALSGGPELPKSVKLVDVKSGALFELDISGRRSAYYPEKHPDTGERTLLPVMKDESGGWRITGHSLPALADVKGDHPAVKNPSTGEVEVAEGSVRTIRR